MRSDVGSSRSSALLYLGHNTGWRKIIGGFWSTCFSRILFHARFTRTGRPAPTRCAACGLCFSRRVLGHCRTIFNRLTLGLRLALTGSVIVINDFGGGALNYRLWPTAIDWLMYHTFLPVLPFMAIVAFRTVLALRAILTFGPVLAVLPLRTFLALGEFLAFWNFLTITIIAVAAVAIVHAIVVITVLIVLILILIIALILDGRLSLSCKYYSIIMLGVLEIVFSHHAVAGALCIPCKSSVFFGDVLSVPPDFDIGTVALVVTG